jgi:diguanylate cyclase (GGDEF)-like protein
MGDLDHFKAVNDTHGHLAGDEVLRRFARMVRNSFRSSDILCRYGGEEFLILLPNTALEVACERAEQVRRTLEETRITCGSSSIRLTASFGVAAFPEHDRTREGLIAAADRALYAAKNCGRNRVARYAASMDGEPECRADVTFAGGR